MPKIEEELDYKLALDEPPKYRVLLHNDNYTTMDFVVMISTRCFTRHRSSRKPS